MLVRAEDKNDQDDQEYFWLFTGSSLVRSDAMPLGSVWKEMHHRPLSGRKGTRAQRAGVCQPRRYPTCECRRRTVSKR